MDDSTKLQNIENRLSALVALVSILGLGTEEERKEAKPEVILSRAGISNTEIAQILDKNLGAVQKTLQRAKK